MAGERGDHLVSGERNHLAQKGYLVWNVVKDAHGDTDVEFFLRIELEEIGLDKRAPACDLVLLCLLFGELQHVAREIDADHAPRATTREVDGVHSGPAPDIEDLLARHVSGLVECDSVALENGLPECGVYPTPEGRA